MAPFGLRHLVTDMWLDRLSVALVCHVVHFEPRSQSAKHCWTAVAKHGRRRTPTEGRLVIWQFIRRALIELDESAARSAFRLPRASAFGSGSSPTTSTSGWRRLISMA